MGGKRYLDVFKPQQRAGLSLAGLTLDYLLHLLNPRPEAPVDARNQTLIIVWLL